MWIMNIVWPVSALFGTVLTLLAYFKYGRQSSHKNVRKARNGQKNANPKADTPFAVSVGKAASHCGSGCMLGDLCAEWIAFGFPTVAVWLGWRTLFPDKMFAVWILDYVCAFLFGIAFQYFAIAPMRHLSIKEGLKQAVKADALSLTAWQVGMYGYMAFASFYLFRTVLVAPLNTDSFEFWFMMQIAMLCGFVTSYPINWWLIRAGIKEEM
jgi:hypothetical protein